MFVCVCVSLGVYQQNKMGLIKILQLEMKAGVGMESIVFNI